MNYKSFISKVVYIILTFLAAYFGTSYVKTLSIIKNLNWESIIFVIIGAMLTYLGTLLYDHRRNTEKRRTLIKNFYQLELQECEKMLCEENENKIYPTSISDEILYNNILDYKKDHELLKLIYKLNTNAKKFNNKVAGLTAMTTFYVQIERDIKSFINKIKEKIESKYSIYV